MYGIKFDQWLHSDSYKLTHWLALPGGKLRLFDTLDDAEKFAQAMTHELESENLQGNLGANCYYPSRVI